MWTPDVATFGASPDERSGKEEHPSFRKGVEGIATMGACSERAAKTHHGDDHSRRTAIFALEPRQRQGGSNYR